MRAIVPQPIEHYAASFSSAEDKLLAELSRETQKKMEYPQMMIGHLEGGLLRFLVQVSGARRILEIGTFTGYSALAMASGLPEGGELITLDRDEKAASVARSFWKKSPHGKKIRLILGTALESLEKVEGPFDMVFIDADKENYEIYWETCVPLVKAGGILAVDNVLWSGRVLSPSEPSDHAIVRFNERVRHDDRVESVMLSVRDGLTLARKK